MNRYIILAVLLATCGFSFAAAPLFRADFDISAVSGVGPSWRLGGAIDDSSPSGFGPLDAATNDIIYNWTSTFGDVDEYKITNIIYQGGYSLTVDVSYSQSGSPRSGGPEAGTAIICRPSTNNVPQLPSLTFGKFPESLYTGARNISIDHLILTGLTNYVTTNMLQTYIAGWSHYPATQNVNVAGLLMTNVHGIYFGSDNVLRIYDNSGSLYHVGPSFQFYANPELAIIDSGGIHSGVGITTPQITLGTNAAITNWSTGGISDLPLTNDLINATNSLNVRVGDLETATNALDTRLSSHTQGWTTITDAPWLTVAVTNISDWATNAASHRVYWTNVVYDAISIGSTGALNPNVSGIYVSAYSAPDFDYSSTSVVYECTNGYMLTSGRFVGSKTYRISGIGSEIPYIFISGSETPDCLYVPVEGTSTGAPTGTWIRVTNVCNVSIGPDALVSDMLTISNKVAVAGIKLGTNTVITNWPDSSISDLPITNDLMNATNSLNIRMGNVETSTGTLNTAVGDLCMATNSLNVFLVGLVASSSRWDKAATDAAAATNIILVVSNAYVAADAAGRAELTNTIAVASNASVAATVALKSDVTNRTSIISNMVDALNVSTGELDTIARAALPKSATNALDIQTLQIRGTSPTNGAVWISTNTLGEGAWATHRSKVYSYDTQTTNVISKTIDIGFHPIAIFATACRYSMTQYSWTLCDRNGSCVGMANADTSPGMLYPTTVLAFIGWGSGSWSIPAPTILSNGISFTPSVSGTALTVNTNVNVRFLFLE